MKRIAICCDGTWNSADRTDDQGRLAVTNVRKIFEVMREASGVQIRRYYAGVGSKAGERALGGVLGWGLSAAISEAYQQCVRDFDPGDELFLFGFSRGAYTARSLAGFIRNSGLLKREYLTDARVDEAYELYRDRTSESHPNSPRAREFRARWCHETRIKFIGVWDTVGSLGIPKIGMGLINMAFSDRWSFHDVDLSTFVDFAYHAVAIDERRGPFTPTLWRQQPGAVGQTMEQVWFPGVHSDVGGGYFESALSDIPLLWMIDKAAACGLVFDHDLIEQRVKPDLTAPAHDSAGLFYKTMSALAHVVPWQNGRLAPREIGVHRRANESVASTAVQRIGFGEPKYSPPNLERFLARGGKVTEVRAHCNRWR
ncbi:MAG TPA: DUF2235 domain-containing protein [Methylomirabilota bacterium]|jgi:uncharacterized protein (DUF2235 family)